MFEKVQYVSLSDQIYETLKQKIINNELVPGEKLDVDRLAEVLGVSRTPVINALNELSHKGYVTIRPRSGSFVRELTKEEVEAIFEFREALELLVLRRAMKAYDSAVLDEFSSTFTQMLSEFGGNFGAIERFFAKETDFHHYLITLCPQIIQDELLNLICLNKRIRRLHLKYVLHTRGADAITKKEVQIHLDIIDAIIMGDEKCAERLLLKDISHTKEDIIANYSQIEAFGAGLAAASVSE